MPQACEKVLAYTVGDACEDGTVPRYVELIRALTLNLEKQRLGYRRVSRRVLDEIPVEVEQLGQSGIAPLKKELRLTRGSAGPRSMSGRHSTRRPGQRSTRPGGLLCGICSVLCSSTVYFCMYCLEHAPVAVPSVPGSSGSPRLISCKVVPSCRNEGRFAQGPPLCCSKSPTTPSAHAKTDGFPLRGIVATTTHTHLPEPGRRKSQIGWAHETRRVRLYATRHGTTKSVVPRGCHLEISKCHPRPSVLWMCYGSLPSGPLLTGLLLRIYQDLRHVSFPLGEGHRDSSES